jgi:predicted acyltransferase
MTVAPPPDEIPLAPEPKRPAEPPPAVVFMADKPLVSEEVEVGVEREPVKAKRLVSLDVFRGITIAAMLIVNNPGDWGHKYAPLEHAEWHGWTPTDLIFPFFLFIVGVAIPFSFAKRKLTESKGEMLAHVWARALSLVLLGLLLHSLPSNGIDPLRPPGFTWLGILRVATFVIIPLGFIALLFPWRSKRISLLTPPIVAIVLLALGFAIHYATRSATAAGLPESVNLGGGIVYPSKLRLPGVLQRIGVCYGIAASIALLAGWRSVLLSFLIFCGAYSALMLKAPFHDHVVGSLTKEDNLERRIDETVFDRTATSDSGQRIVKAKHTYGEYPDPEGLLSTLPAIGSVLLGILVGYPLLATNRTNAEKCAKLLANGVVITILGVLLSWWLMPINKKIWTPSFTVFTAGMGMLTLGAVFYSVDVRGRRGWAWPFKVFGMNAIAAFILAGLIGRVATMVKVNDPSTGKTVAALTFFKQHLNDSVHRAGAWWSHTLPQLPPLDTPNNVSLAYAIAFVFSVFLVLLAMYACRIFLKV